jgi:hypothetical protein
MLDPIVACWMTERGLLSLHGDADVKSNQSIVFANSSDNLCLSLPWTHESFRQHLFRDPNDKQHVMLLVQNGFTFVGSSIGTLNIRSLHRSASIHLILQRCFLLFPLRLWRFLVISMVRIHETVHRHDIASLGFGMFPRDHHSA